MTLVQLDAYLASSSYLGSATGATLEDYAQCNAIRISDVDATSMPHLARWHGHIRKLMMQHSEFDWKGESLPAGKAPNFSSAPAPKMEAASKKGAVSEKDTSQKKDGADTPVPIFIFAGQSNCVGRGIPDELPADLVQRVAQHIQICFDLERHRPEEAHVSGWTTLSPSCQVNPKFGAHFGPEFSSADELLNAMAGAGTPDLRFAKFAMGSSSLVVGRDGGDPEWNPDGEHVKAFIEFLREHYESVGRSAYFAGLFWNQGNSDLKVKDSDGSAELYTERLVALVERLRIEFEGTHRGLPFVACHVRKGSKAKTTQNVNAAISMACERLSNAKCISIPEGATLLPNDDFHFDSGTLLKLGHECAKAMSELL